MARYSTTLHVSAPPEPTCAYVADFRHATWDPRVAEARRLDGDGPVGVGAAFELVSPLPLGLHLVFPYRIVRFEAGRRVSLQGDTWFATYEDDITFEPDGSGTRLRYDAQFDLKGWLRLGGPLMQAVFQRVGADATRGMPSAIESGLARTRPGSDRPR